MNDTGDRHLIAADFRDALEQDVVLTLRRQSQFSAPPSAMRRRRLRTFATLIIGVSLGAGTAVASAQVQSARQRDSLELSVNARRQLASLRLQLAEAEYQEAKKSFAVGARSRDELASALLAMRAAEMNIQRIDLDLEEVRATGAAPRDELWAPLAGKRDFVAERLKLDAAVMQQQLESQEQVLQELRVRMSIGAIAERDTWDLASEVSQSARNFQLTAEKLSLRQKFLENQLNQQALVTRLQLLQATHQLQRVVERLQLARKRSARVKDQLAVGAATELEAKRTEVDVLERSLEVQQLQQLLQQLKAVRKPE